MSGTLAWSQNWYVTEAGLELLTILSTEITGTYNYAWLCSAKLNTSIREWDLNIKHKFPQFTSQVVHVCVFICLPFLPKQQNPRKHSFHCLTVTLAWCMPIPPTLQLRFIDEEKLKATVTVICPFSPSVTMFWAEWWLSNTGEQHKGLDRTLLLFLFLRSHSFLSALKTSYGSEEKKPTLGLQGPINAAVDTTDSLFVHSVHYIWILCGVHWSSVPMGHHGSHKQTVVRNDRHWYHMYSCSNVCLSSGFSWKSTSPKEQCIKISITAKIAKLYTIVLIGICPTSQNQSCSIIRSYGKLSITSESATYLLWIDLALLCDPLTTT